MERPEKSEEPRFIALTEARPGLAQSSAVDFRLSRIENPGDAGRAAYTLLASEFGGDTLEPYESFARMLEPTPRDGPASSLVACASLSMEGGRLVGGVLSAEILPLPSVAGSKPAYLYAISHQVTAAVLRKTGVKGVGRRLWQFGFELAKERIALHGGVFLYSLAEAQSRATGFWSWLGYRHPEGVRYWQPPVRWSADGSSPYEAVEETLMLLPVEAPPGTISKAILEGVVTDLYEGWWLAPNRESLSPPAMERVEAYVMGQLFADFQHSLPAGMDLRLEMPPES